MIAVSKDLLFEQARKSKLIYWQLFDNSQEIGRNDDDIDIEDSINILSELLSSLEPYAKPGERLKVSMQNKPMTANGKQKGGITRTYMVALTSSQPIAGPQNAGFNQSLYNENQELKLKLMQRELQEKHNEERNSLLKRIEALEQEPDESNIDKTIGHINTLLNHPLTQMLVGQFLQTGTKPVSPTINGIDQDQEILTRLKAIDPNYTEVLQSILNIAESDSQQYFMYRSMLVKNA